MIPSNCATIGTSTLEDIKQVSVEIYPNPFSTAIIIHGNDISHSRTSMMKIYNAVGKEIMNIPITQEFTTLETSSFPSGMYYYKITSNNKTIQSGKLTVQQ